MLRIDCAGWDINGEWAKPIRRSVFIDEQGIPEHEEWDDSDGVSMHAIAWINGQAVGTARLLPEGKIGRMAVLREHRKHGIGAALLNTLIGKARAQGHPTVRLSAQAHAVAFYARHGFVTSGAPHEEVGIPHQWMELNLKPQRH
ncbi:GNAT family N-acetyltransferase [Limnobacter humi]|uniref:GNAT family N-acetyltransferase n=1 Tax=Limnobacter humi TaxID=1778671 RepID=A0ABT1WDE8_9BURK|nr:GNAT family N-acetyltransferase [Limnobacter humi]MCQ8895520.1 GNAT family N-acetyltransferase [Limnobacter humi]